MPELPEVEVTRRHLAAVSGARIESVRLGKPLRWPLGVEPAFLAGQRIGALGRRGKYLLMPLDRGVLLVHLGMSGSLIWQKEGLPQPGPHDHFDWVTDRGVLRLHDPRRFGSVLWSSSLQAEPAHRLLQGLGVEPFSAAFSPDCFYQAMRARRAPIKSVLLAGDVVVGVGNIYASEALFLAGIRPTMRVHRLSRARVARLHAAIVQVLQNAIEQGGSSLRDFAHPTGTNGHFQLQAMVYGRSGLPCRVCGTLVRQVRQGQRSSYFCPSCQSF